MHRNSLFYQAPPAPLLHAGDWCTESSVPPIARPLPGPLQPKIRFWHPHDSLCPGLLKTSSTPRLIHLAVSLPTAVIIINPDDYARRAILQCHHLAAQRLCAFQVTTPPPVRHLDPGLPTLASQPELLLNHCLVLAKSRPHHHRTLTPCACRLLVPAQPVSASDVADSRAAPTQLPQQGMHCQHKDASNLV